jgi:predicted Fe-S protein YdhL (DUF1289 family)
VRDLDELTAALAGSRFRRRFKLGPKERDYLAEKGPAIVLEHARTFIAQRLAPAAPRNDGKQTPWRGHPVFVAQHATATCCRGCLAKWHGIERGHELSATEQNHVLAVIARWLEAELGRNTIAPRHENNPGTDANKNLGDRTLAAKRD